MRDEVRVFAKLMEQKLRLHGDRPGWRDEDVKWLMMRLYDEAGELSKTLILVGDHEVTPELAQAIALECADVANFAMMVADRMGGLKP